MVIELDGPVHAYQKNKDFYREKVIESLGLKVVRFENNELSDLEKVKKKLVKYISI